MAKGKPPGRMSGGSMCVSAAERSDEMQVASSSCGRGDMRLMVRAAGTRTPESIVVCDEKGMCQYSSPLASESERYRRERASRAARSRHLRQSPRSR